MTIHSEWYRIFLHAAQLGNLTKAAQALHMTQPSVSYAIKQLEQHLDITLFDRLSKGVRLTPEGEVLFGHVALAFSQLARGEQHMVERKRYTDGHIRIGANGAITKDILLPKLDQFHQQYPQIKIKLVQQRTSQIVTQLKQNGLDIGFVHLPLDDAELDIRPLATQPYCIIAGNKYKQLAEQPLSTEKLLQIPLLLLTAGSSTRLFVEQWFTNQGFHITADFELNSMEMLVAFAERNYGIAFVPTSLVSIELAQERLVLLQTQTAIDHRPLGIATPKHHSLSIVAQKFLTLFTDSDSST
ncbi:LysR family transcriptional regulator [Paenibacillus yanchengensis]|uniref:LysR family transcriptional regulator n=1 Tax=Paenibacillus yanchengensis TaxID=2035833 RepID=A0ABW4YN38_9BACL